jgi:L-ascorbate metabolism protein UlaG (beta-lactamase superfamily)
VKPRFKPASFLKILRWKLFSTAKPWPKNVINTHQPTLPSLIQAHQAFFTFVNHATMLIQLENGSILTDPIFSGVAGPWGLLGPRRVRKPGLSLDQLPKIDTVLISHNHYDHLDIPSLQALEKKDPPLFVVPLGNIPL